MNRKGIVLIELVIVLSVFAVLIVSFDYSYEKWLGNYEVECEARKLLADLMRARLLAVQECREHFLTTDEHSYTIFEDRDEDGDPEPGEELPSFPKHVKYSLVSNVSSRLSFNTRGILQVPRTLRFDVAKAGLTPDYDCIIISKTRIILGKYRGNGCKIN